MTHTVFLPGKFGLSIPPQWRWIKNISVNNTFATDNVGIAVLAGICPSITFRIPITRPTKPATSNIVITIVLLLLRLTLDISIVLQIHTYPPANESDLHYIRPEKLNNTPTVLCNAARSGHL